MASLKTLRGLISELRLSTPHSDLKESLALRYVMSQYRKYKTTDQQLCKAREEMKFMADAYLCYLQSSRRYREINEAFSGKGERSVNETAKLVGFKLPHDPK